MPEITDRELLELAAKALYAKTGNGDNAGYRSWNPIEHDRDALRLAVALHICITIWSDGTPSASIPSTGREFAVQGVTCPYEAARRAIVRAAAEIGRNMK
jgi:hypothetical protein